MNPWIAIGMLALVSVLIPAGMLSVSSLIRPSVSEQGKRATYESAEVPTGNARLQFNTQYYMVALLFLVFDIETVLIFPWTVIYRDALAMDGIGLTNVLAPMLVFIGILVVGLAWAWRKGVVQWMRTPAHEQRTTHE
ncbi:MULTISPECIES: NADH-quinone oxidoreductase subunit A [Halobacterium]|uniref:NADH dehydrogenase-like complex subunit A n=4 Tax=Halobacterium salinarum TaxID=2242 RepID=Q9HRM1_HALSA|nr:MULTISPECIES: NADH-quinone oxidoreductase subunit A [Halobacterium]AAG19137.1 NADH dehydrogenase/oxidoreductase-like protein [Halobacterium salinarum NRC-1]MBB6089979.1 NADH-quinone oxidoreductase subunit A [Halobacterium salinarum]MCF2165702.1 NADH-quinone oxidoreductase subunit A [Halobacterium salinarum]MCF2166572.1 NADH-quinone oxidoreductase subunit A [Halobacterium salinarum]MCF2207899.1 NADH-quinone oxidoreductase subunit A [Halobacterium salinarum]